MHRGGAGHALEGAVEHLDAVLFGLLRTRLHPGFVDLHHVGAGREQVLDFGVDRRGVVERELLLVLVVVVLALRRHREGTRHGDLDPAVGVGAQELHVAQFDRSGAPDLADYPRHRRSIAGAVHDLGGMLVVDAVERGREAIGVAFPPLLAVGDDVEPGTLLVADREQGRIVLRFLELRLRNAPEVLRAHPRHRFRQPLPIDQPSGLRVGADQGRGEEHQVSASACRLGRALRETQHLGRSVGSRKRSTQPTSSYPHFLSYG